MPILHIQVAGQGQDPNGNPVDLPPGMALHQRGPCVQVSIGLEQVMAQQLLQQGLTVPTPQSGLALIDTGASVTCIDKVAAERMGLPPIDVVRMATASEASAEQSVYPASFEIVGLPMQINAPRAIGAELAAQGLVALIGRDLLANCSLHYNGFAGQFTISI